MSKISKEGYDKILIIKDALNSMFDKLSSDFYERNDKTKVKDIEKLYTLTNVFELVKDEFESISNIIDESGKWEEVK